MRAVQNIFLAMSLLLAAGSAQADIIAPDTLIQNTVQEVLAIVKQDKDIQAGNQTKVLALVDAKAVSYTHLTLPTILRV